jgi:DNA transformation protein
MAVSDEFISHFIDQLSSWGKVFAHRMFGGAGLYCDGVIFGIIVDDVVFLKVDDSNRDDFIRAGSFPFNPYPEKAKEKTVMSYYEIPVDILEDRDQLAIWVGRSLAVAKKKN